MSRVPITLPRATDDVKLRSMIGAVIYVRVSTKEQTENLSLPTQLAGDPRILQFGIKYGF